MCVNETALMYRCEMWWFGRELEVSPAQENYFGFGFGTSQKGVHDKAGQTKVTIVTKRIPPIFKKNANSFLFFSMPFFRDGHAHGHFQGHVQGHVIFLVLMSSQRGRCRS